MGRGDPAARCSRGSAHSGALDLYAEVCAISETREEGDGQRADGQRAGVSDGQRANGQRAGVSDGQRADGQRAGVSDGQRADGLRAGVSDGQRADGQRAGLCDGQSVSYVDAACQSRRARR